MPLSNIYDATVFQVPTHTHTRAYYTYTIYIQKNVCIYLLIYIMMHLFICMYVPVKSHQTLCSRKSYFLSDCLGQKHLWYHVIWYWKMPKRINVWSGHKQRMLPHARRICCPTTRSNMSLYDPMPPGFPVWVLFFHKGRSFPSIQAIQATHLVASSNRWSRENTFCRRPRTSRLYSCRRKPRWPLPQTKSCVMWVKQWDFTMKSGDLMGSIMGFNRI